MVRRLFGSEAVGDSVSARDLEAGALTQGLHREPGATPQKLEWGARPCFFSQRTALRDTKRGVNHFLCPSDSPKRFSPTVRLIVQGNARWGRNARYRGTQMSSPIGEKKFGGAPCRRTVGELAINILVPSFLSKFETMQARQESPLPLEEVLCAHVGRDNRAGGPEELPARQAMERRAGDARGPVLHASELFGTSEEIEGLFVSAEELESDVLEIPFVNVNMRHSRT